MGRLMLLPLVVLFASLSAFGQKATQKDFAHCQNVLVTTNPLEIDDLSSADRSDLELCRSTDTMNGIRVRLSLHDRRFGFWRTFRGHTLPVWFDLLDAFCEFHPSAQYIDLFDNVEHCSSDVTVIHTDRAALDKTFQQSLTLSVNFDTFVEGQNAEDGLNKG